MHFDNNDEKKNSCYVLIHLFAFLLIYGIKPKKKSIYIPLKNISVMRRRHHFRKRGQNAEFLANDRNLRPLSKEGTPTVTRGLGFCGIIRRTVPI